jgi:aconitate hydratase
MSKSSLSDAFATLEKLPAPFGDIAYFSLDKLALRLGFNLEALPFSIRILLENILRAQSSGIADVEQVKALAAYDPRNPGQIEVPFQPARVILQDFTGVPALVDLAAMRSAVARLGGDPARINPLIPADLVIDHSVQVDFFNSPEALGKNAELEFKRNRERYEFLRWGQEVFKNFRVVPPASGIVHQVNLEYWAKVVLVSEQAGGKVAFPDTLVGCDSHTTMINGLGVLGWGVGGIEAEAGMLGQPLFMPAPEVVGFKLTGALPEGATATDLVLTVTQILRKLGVVDKFVEFCGPGLSSLTLPDRATIANMAPEYGATMGFFPVDAATLTYLLSTGRPAELVELVEKYCRRQRLFRTEATPEPLYSKVVELNLGSIKPCLAGPKRPQDRVEIDRLQEVFREKLAAPFAKQGFDISPRNISKTGTVEIDGEKTTITHGSTAIAAITSCTNTSNPAVMIAAGLMAKKAVEAGLTIKSYVKTSLAPGSKVVAKYLEISGLLPYLEKIGFHIVGYGCTTCIGNSGPLDERVSKAVTENDLVVAAVLSGNRNFEGRINPHVQASFLASPPLVIAYALAGTVEIDLTKEPLGRGLGGKEVFLKDIWPTVAEIQECVSRALKPEFFKEKYADIERGNPVWNAIPVSGEALYGWREESTYIQEPPFFFNLEKEPQAIKPIVSARALVMVGDSVTTDHISPAGAISPDSPAGKFLLGKGVKKEDFNSYGSRRGNDRVMTRGTFANVRLKNLLAHGAEGGFTTYFPENKVMTIHEAAMLYREAGAPTVVLAGADYGMGSSRDWAAKGALLLGVKAVLAQSFERIHRSNLVGMGVLPLQFLAGETCASLGLDGSELFNIRIDDKMSPQGLLEVEAQGVAASKKFNVLARIDSEIEKTYYRHGGILNYVLRGLLK